MKKQLNAPASCFQEGGWRERVLASSSIGFMIPNSKAMRGFSQNRCWDWWSKKSYERWGLFPWTQRNPTELSLVSKQNALEFWFVRPNASRTSDFENMGNHFNFPYFSQPCFVWWGTDAAWAQIKIPWRKRRSQRTAVACQLLQLVLASVNFIAQSPCPWPLLLPGLCWHGSARDAGFGHFLRSKHDQKISNFLGIRIIRTTEWWRLFGIRCSPICFPIRDVFYFHFINLCNKYLSLAGSCPWALFHSRGMGSFHAHYGCKGFKSVRNACRRSFPFPTGRMLRQQKTCIRKCFCMIYECMSMQFSLFMLTLC